MRYVPEPISETETREPMTFGTTNPRSSCCDARVKANLRDGGWFCDKCGKATEPGRAKPKFSTLSTTRKPTGEREAFERVWARCKGKSEVSGAELLPYGHPMWHWQFCHLLPKGSYQNDRTDLANIVATTVMEHTDEWPFVKEKTDAELRELGMSKWIPKVTVFRALRLRYNKRLSAQLSGKHD